MKKLKALINKPTFEQWEAILVLNAYKYKDWEISWVRDMVAFHKEESTPRWFRNPYESKPIPPWMDVDEDRIDEIINELLK